MKRFVNLFLFSIMGALLFWGTYEGRIIGKAYGSQPNILYASEPVQLTESMIVSNGYRNVTGLPGL